MIASIVDLRYKMKNILKALDRNETVTIMYHGKEKGVIVPSSSSTNMEMDVREHPFFGMTAEEVDRPVEVVMEELRGVRY
jgi:hypothetical protein